MPFPCPYCQFRINPKAPPKPGKYTPTCPKCSAKFVLLVPDDPGEEWVTRKLAAPGPKAALAPVNPSADTEVIEAGGRKQAPEEQTAIHEPAPAKDDQTAVFAHANKTETGTDETVAPEPKAKPAKARKAAATDVEIPDTLGGYEVVKELGRGGMGAVYLARQVSLDRAVALKVMNTRWASDPVFLARFTREAFAAAQLVHHNVVQIYDIGEQDGINFFSMEFVEGKSLGDLLKRDGKVGLEEAVGHVLQAARGLKFAHDRGMIHRDVKPDNLMLNVHGIVKVADLGLVKTAAMARSDDEVPEPLTDPDFRPSKSSLKSLPSDITLAHTAMGSPGYMSPEQGRDAATVDPRADIYSLGCTLYALLAGHPPFQGNNVFDIINKHATEPVAPIAGAPKEVNAVLLKSLAKRADDRQPSMDEFIADLERLMPGKGATGKPTEEHLATLEAAVKRFQSAPMAKVRKTLIAAFLIGSLIAAVVGIALGSGLIIGGAVASIVETVLAYFVVDGIFGKSYLFRRVREWAFGARIGDWIMAVVGLVIFVLVLWLVGLLWVWLGTAVVAVGLAFLFHLAIDRPLSNQRRAAVEDCELMLKRLRVAGMDEDALRMFVAKNAGRGWEGFYEALFGYEAKLSVRSTVEEQAGNRLPHFGGWRDPLIARLDRAQQARREVRTRKVLQKVESKKLQAEGVDRNEAEDRAHEQAEYLVERAAEIRVARKKPVNVKALLASTAKPAKRPPKPAGYHVRKVIDTVLGWKVRFVVGALLVAVGAMWVRGQLHGANLDQALDTVTSSESTDSTKQAAKQAAGSLSRVLSRGQPVSVPVVGRFLTWVDSVNPLIAGLIILLSTFNPRALGINLQLVGAAVALLGHQFGVIPAIGPVEPHQLTMILGAGLAIAGVIVGRRS